MPETSKMRASRMPSAIRTHSWQMSSGLPGAWAQRFLRPPQWLLRCHRVCAREGACHAHRQPGERRKPKRGYSPAHPEAHGSLPFGVPARDHPGQPDSRSLGRARSFGSPDRCARWARCRSCPGCGLGPNRLDHYRLRRDHRPSHDRGRTGAEDVGPSPGRVDGSSHGAAAEALHLGLHPLHYRDQQHLQLVAAPGGPARASRRRGHAYLG